MRKPRVMTKCVANTYAAPNERIIEFGSDNGGGLIAFRMVDENLVVDVYRTDPTVIVRLDPAVFTPQTRS
jgi:hypothetical protein